MMANCLGTMTWPSRQAPEKLQGSKGVARQNSVPRRSRRTARASNQQRAACREIGADGWDYKATPRVASSKAFAYPSHWKVKRGGEKQIANGSKENGRGT